MRSGVQTGVMPVLRYCCAQSKFNVSNIDYFYDYYIETKYKGLTDSLNKEQESF